MDIWGGGGDNLLSAHGYSVLSHSNWDQPCQGRIVSLEVDSFYGSGEQSQLSNILPFSRTDALEGQV